MKNKCEIFLYVIGVSLTGIFLYKGMATLNGVRNIFIESIFIIPIIVLLACFFYVTGKKGRKK